MWASLVAQVVKNPPEMWETWLETWVWIMGWEDPLEKRMATHSSILAWRIPWREQCGRLQISSQIELLTIRIKNQFSPNMTLLHKSFSKDLFLNAQASIVFLTPPKKREKKKAEQLRIRIQSLDLWAFRLQWFWDFHHEGQVNFFSFSSCQVPSWIRIKGNSYF